MPKKIQNDSLTMSKIAKTLSDEEAAWKFVEDMRWSKGVVCPHCGTIGNAYFLKPQSGARTTKAGNVSYRRIWKCGACREQFSVLVGTIFEDSKIPLSKWLMAIHEMCADKNGISSCELARKLDITQKSAWHLGHRIRYAMQRAPLAEKLQGVVEADETYFGGQAKFMHKSKRDQKITGHGTVNKIPVFTMIARDGEIRSQKMPSANNYKVRDTLTANVDTNATLMTDTSPLYPMASKEFAAHEVVDHSAGEYVRKTANGKAHINTAEGHFSQLKRSIDGTHHHVSEKHLDRYLAEFDYRRNTRKTKDGTRTEDSIIRMAGKRLTYDTPIEGAEVLVKADKN